MLDTKGFKLTLRICSTYCFSTTFVAVTPSLLRYTYVVCLVCCPKRPDRPWDPPSLLSGYWLCFHSGVEVKNEWIRASTAHICLHDVGRDNFTLVLRTHKSSYPSTLSSRGGQLDEIREAQIRQGSCVSKIIFFPFIWWPCVPVPLTTVD